MTDIQQTPMPARPLSQPTSVTLPMNGLSTTRRLTVLFATLAVLCVPALEAVAEQAWVRGEIRLNLRSGPGTQFRILGGVASFVEHSFTPRRIR